MTHFILCSRYRFADGKEVVDLRSVHPNAAQLSGIFFPKFRHRKLVYKLVGTQLSLFTTFHMFFFQFIFVLPARYVHMHNFMGKLKQTQVVSMLEVNTNHIFYIIKTPDSFMFFDELT